MFQSEFSDINKTDQSPSQNAHRRWNERTVTYGQELCTHFRFHSDNMKHRFSNKMPGFMGETVLQPTCLSLRAAAGNSMPENRLARSSPKKLPAAFTEQGVWHVHQRYTQTSFPVGMQTFPSPLTENELGRKSPAPPHFPP